MKDIELPPLSKSDHPEPRTMQWSDLELYAIKSYARAAVEADRAQRVPDVDALADKIAECLRGTYHCNRVWEAWHVGTMSQDDFEPVDESETPREIAEEIAALLAPTPAQPAPTPAAPNDEQISLHTITDPVRRAAHEAYANQPEGQGHYVRIEAVIAAVKSVLATAQPAQQESPCACWPGRMCSRSNKCADDVRQATHQEPPQPVERKPMTDEQFEDWWVTLADYNITGRRMYREQAVQFLLAIERHHGIRE